MIYDRVRTCTDVTCETKCCCGQLLQLSLVKMNVLPAMGKTPYVAAEVPSSDSSDNEKSPYAAADAVSDSEEDLYIDPKKEKRLLWKTDVCLTSLLVVSWICAYLDRSNIGNAAIAGMLPDLNMSKQQLASK